MVEHLLAEGLSLSVGPEIGLEAEAVHHGYVRTHSVERCSRFRRVLYYMTSASGQHWVYGLDAVCRGLDLDQVHWLHEARGRHEESRIRHSTCSGNHLPAPAMNRFLRDGGVQDFDFDVPNRLVTKRTIWSMKG